MFSASAGVGAIAGFIAGPQHGTIVGAVRGVVRSHGRRRRGGGRPASISPLRVASPFAVAGTQVLQTSRRRGRPRQAVRRGEKLRARPCAAKARPAGASAHAARAQRLPSPRSRPPRPAPPPRGSPRAASWVSLAAPPAPPLPLRLAGRRHRRWRAVPTVAPGIELPGSPRGRNVGASTAAGRAAVPASCGCRGGAR